MWTPALRCRALELAVLGASAGLWRLRQHTAIVQVTDDKIDGDIFLGLVDEYNLGAGETECLAICLSQPGIIFCCDDRKARETAEHLLGNERVIGSLRLLKWSVAAGLVTGADAYRHYQEMKLHGGFLPDVAVGWFDQ